jgi:hypothetical protein
LRLGSLRERFELKNKKWIDVGEGSKKNLAPQVGLEPTTLRLTAECSAIELLRSKKLYSILVDVRGIEPLTSALRTRRSPS